jgi:5-hydroxyisourate hydrolase-like protein (transthyretin family)
MRSGSRLSVLAFAFYPEVSMVVRIDDPTQYYHVHLLVSPFGYSMNPAARTTSGPGMAN